MIRPMPTRPTTTHAAKVQKGVEVSAAVIRKLEAPKNTMPIMMRMRAEKRSLSLPPKGWTKPSTTPAGASRRPEAVGV